jgi:AcrR family transcriptional regulator
MPRPTKPKPSELSNHSKDELFWKILDAALKLDLTKGHLRWKMTDLSRASGVTRSLIYYYFGHSKDSIIQAAINITGEEFFGLSEARQALWDSGRVWESVKRSRELVKSTPHIPIFYLNQRQPGSPFHKAMMELETRHFQKLSLRFPNAHPEMLRAAFATLLGLVTVADISDETLKIYLGVILKNLNGITETSPV